MSIVSLSHPAYKGYSLEWKLFRDTFVGGDNFIFNYLQRFSALETDADFIARQKTAYCPAFAKAAVIEVRDAIYQRTGDIVRLGGPENYQNALRGQQGGVDLAGHTMNNFIGSIVLEELLVLSKVGIFIDKPEQEPAISRLYAREYRPYLYYYCAEDILNWVYDDRARLIRVLLREQTPVVDTEFGLVTGYATKYRFLSLQDEGVLVQMFDDKYKIENFYTLKLRRLPFVISSISHSLLMDVAKYQVALLNLGSSDLSYAMKANFAFYTEQFEPGSDFDLPREDADGTAANTDPTKQGQLPVGPLRGRRYPKGTDRPGFINPSSEPLKASMDKQKQLKEEIRELVHLSLRDVQNTNGEQGLEAGLSCIGEELRHAEQQIAEIWAEYEGEKTQEISIQYPRNYSLRSEADRLEEAGQLEEISPKIPSQTCQKEIAKKVARLLVGNNVTQKTLATIDSEIEEAPVVVSDPDVVRNDMIEGMVSVETASRSRGYPEGEVEQAKIDRAERAAAIALAQSKANQSGVAEMNQPGSGKDQKKADKQAGKGNDGGKGTMGGKE